MSLKSISFIFYSLVSSCSLYLVWNDLYNAIDELEDKYKDAVILRYIDDLKIEDISKILDRPVNTIKTHLRKALKDMKKMLKEGYFNE